MEQVILEAISIHMNDKKGIGVVGVDSLKVMTNLIAFCDERAAWTDKETAVDTV